MPWFVEFQNVRAPGLQVIGVSVDDTVEKLRPYVKEPQDELSGAPGPAPRRDPGRLRPTWGIPVTTIISRDGKICAKHAGISSKEAFEKEIKSLL